MCRAEEFEHQKKKILDKWTAKSGMQDFTNYFKTQWLSGKFTKWQIFHTPPGFATTANPCESFNGKIKEVFTEHVKLSIISFITLALDKIIPHYCFNNREFLFYRLNY